MKYYLIAGEASGDLHASRLMQSLRREDPEAEFRFYGGDLMTKVGGTRVKHYSEMAYMGFITVLMHLPTILKNMRNAKRDISAWKPDVVILVDYPGFNLDMAKYVHAHKLCPVYYYISPKIWAWKERRIKRIRRDVDELFSILPFEVEFFEQKHHYPIHYVGNPTREEVDEFLRNKEQERVGDKEVIALLAGSRRQEINDNLPAMIEATRSYADQYDVVLAGAPAIPDEYYQPFVEGTHVRVVHDQTYKLLSEATAALVTSGTATLETCCFGVPQVVSYRLPMAWAYGLLRKLLLKVKYVSLVNLIAGREIVPELVADTFSVEALKRELARVMPGGEGREPMLRGYDEVRQRLGSQCAPDEAASLMIKQLKKQTI